MPTLDFKGKQIIYAHHLTVPSRTLEPDAPKSLPPKDQQPSLDFLRSTESALNSDRAERITKQAKQKQKTAIVFATHKFMGQKELTGMGIVFCGLPYESFAG